MRGRCAGGGRRGQQGALLVGLLVSITVMMILLTASAQAWSIVVRRDREEELIFRGNQYIDALRAYQAEHGGTYPTELKVLLDAGPRGHRYIRQLYPDPFSSDGEWNLLFLGPDRKSAFNPNARIPDLGLPGLPAGLVGLGGGSPSGRRGAGEGPASRRRKSGFESGNVNTPIVGVVSHGPEAAFRAYHLFPNKDYYDEWEFHVFLRDVPRPQAGAVPGLNINPGGKAGPGGGMNIVSPGGPGSGLDQQRKGSDDTDPGGRRGGPGGGSPRTRGGRGGSN